MIQAIYVYSYFQMQEELKDLPSDARIIGCVDVGGLVKEPLFETDDYKLLLRFDDCVPDEPIFNMQLDPMTREQAVQVIRYIEGINQGRVRHDLHVHCIGGQARSTAIAQFAAWIADLTTGHIRTKNPFRPNKHVSKLLLDTYNEMQLIGARQ